MGRRTAHEHARRCLVLKPALDLGQSKLGLCHILFTIEINAEEVGKQRAGNFDHNWYYVLTLLFIGSASSRPYSLCTKKQKLGRMACCIRERKEIPQACDGNSEDYSGADACDGEGAFFLAIMV